MYEGTITYHGSLEEPLTDIKLEILSSARIEPNQQYQKDLFANKLSQPIFRVMAQVRLDAMEATRDLMISLAREKTTDYVIVNKPL